MSQEDAVRTSVLSKSWREIWCTRPNLDLSDATFKGNNGEFISLLENTLRRYCEQRLSLDECSLSYTSLDSTSVSLLEKWIPLITSAGVKNFRLSIVPAHFRHVKLPSVVFETESLRDLHVERFILDQKAIEKTVLFKHLNKLRLEQVCIDDRMFQKIIASCPLIETMFLKSCNTIRNIKASNLRRLKDFYFSSWSDEEDCSTKSIQHLLKPFRSSPFRMNDEDIFQENLDLVQDIKGGNKPAVALEELKLHGELSYFSPLSNGLFCICRPRKIGAINYMNAESVLKNLMQGENGNYQDQLRQLWLPDLEEVGLEIYDKNRGEWDPTSLSDLPDFEEGKRISTRFALKWRESL
ncbi:PREDICTED: putative F-box/LRR-repeat protein At3g28410 [Erythranthe guttata]|uniref:putative F-box/LRR-repeat protein At3g28410 n=1 Tax=Erythranthe guttata TaxID=4155 RepID=UPI00064DF001|nr:PREDICTED: putative F-box/LRR-repeat protein At3g28410 [Erythranthe guttata]|eukprot:XP_012852340.1 PREDICTED: putative F-box/LRR-repeat protein At3g28410 [Erythranthe guttata]